MKENTNPLIIEDESSELNWCYYSGMPSPSFYEQKEIDDKKNAEEKNPSAIDEKRNTLSK